MRGQKLSNRGTEWEYVRRDGEEVGTRVPAEGSASGKSKADVDVQALK